MAWIQLTIQDGLPPASQERQGIVAAKGVDDYEDILMECIDIFRDAIRSSGQPLGPEGTIPRSLSAYVLARTIWLFVSRGLPENKAIQSPSRQKEADRAEEVLQQIIDGKLKVISDDPAQTISHGVTVVRRGRRIRTGSFDKLGAS